MSDASSTYSADDIDFLVAYVFQKTYGMSFPRGENRWTEIGVYTAGSKHSTLEQYREAWRLMKPRGIA